MFADDKTKGNAENKACILGLEKKLANLEAMLQNVSMGMQRGNLNPEQEQRLAAVEERLENAEDLQMVANLDMIKIKDSMEKSCHGGESQLVFSQAAPSSKCEELESLVSKLNKKIEFIESQRPQGKVLPGAGAEIRGELIGLKKDLDSFKSETEESIKIIVSSIKKIAEKAM